MAAEFPIEVNLEHREVLLKHTNETFVFSDSVESDYIINLLQHINYYTQNPYNIIKKTLFIDTNVKFHITTILNDFTTSPYNDGMWCANQMTINVFDNCIIIQFIAHIVADDTMVMCILCANKIEPLTLK